MLIAEVFSVLKNECGFTENSKFLLGVSGGPDSVCLLDILSQLPYEIIVGHLNHNLRPSSEEEMFFVNRLADKHGCKFVSKSVNVKEIASNNKIGIEEAARKARYQFLFDAAIKEKVNAVLVAHHADDQVETFLINLIRGSGLDGMAGMKKRTISEFNQKIPIIRPMLEIWRGEILSYVNSHQLEFRLDETNQSSVYTRTRIRNHLIPELQKINPSIKKTLFKTQQIIQNDHKFIQDVISSASVDTHLKTQDKEVSIDIHRFKKLTLSLQRMVVKNIIETNFYNQNIITFSNIEFIRRMLTREIQSDVLKVTKGLYVFTSGEKGILSKEQKCSLNETSPNLKKDRVITIQPGRYPISKNWWVEIIESSISQVEKDVFKNVDPFRAFTDADIVGNQVLIRSWHSGDRFTPLGMDGHSTKLSDFWINHKINSQLRSSWPLFVSNDEIFWIPGIQQSHKSRITPDTRRIYIFRLINQRNIN